MEDLNIQKGKLQIDDKMEIEEESFDDEFEKVQENNNIKQNNTNNNNINLFGHFFGSSNTSNNHQIIQNKTMPIFNFFGGGNSPNTNTAKINFNNKKNQIFNSINQPSNTNENNLSGQFNNLNDPKDNTYNIFSQSKSQQQPQSIFGNLVQNHIQKNNNKKPFIALTELGQYEDRFSFWPKDELAKKTLKYYKIDNEKTKELELTFKQPSIKFKSSFIPVFLRNGKSFVFSDNIILINDKKMDKIYQINVETNLFIHSGIEFDNGDIIFLSYIKDSNNSNTEKNRDYELLIYRLKDNNNYSLS